MLPRMLKHKEIMDDIIQSDEGFGFADIEFAYQERRELDLLKQAQIDDIYAGKIITINEVRQNLGKDPMKGIPEADMLGEFTPNGFVPLSAGDQADRAGQIADATRDPNPEPDATPPGKKKPSDGKNPKKKVSTQLLEKRLGARIDPAKVSHETERARISLRDTMHKVFMRQKERAESETKRVLKARLSSFLKDGDSPSRTRTPEEIADAIYVAMEADFLSLPSQIQGTIEGAVLAGVNDGIIQIEISDSGLLSAANDIASEYARARAAEMVGMKYDADGNLEPNPNAQWQISETTRLRIRDIVDTSFKSETKMGDVERSIQSALAEQAEGNGIFSESRAELIARTETSNALVQGNLAVWKKSGIVKTVAWMLSNDHEGPDECDVMAEGSPYPLTETPLPIVDTHPNCACGLSVVEVYDTPV